MNAAGSPRTPITQPAHQPPTANRQPPTPLLEALRRWSHLLDSAFRVPGTSLRFGWDPILGLIPGLGDLATPIFSALLLLQGFQMRIPKVVQVRMLLNVLIDLALGAVPVVGDLFDFAWKANDRNLRLLERHASRAMKPTTGDWVLVGAVLLLIVVCAAIPVIAFVLILRMLGRALI